MYEHLRPYDSYPREYLEVVIDEAGHTGVTTFVLVHGAFRGGWAWQRVRPLLVAGRPRRARAEPARLR